MRRLGYLLALVLVVAALAPSTAAAAPSPIHFSISSNARYVSPTAILVPVTVTCDPPGGAFVQVTVLEPSTGGAGAGTAVPLCTGSAQTVAVQILGGPFTPDKAYANGFACRPGSFCDSDQRQIQITL